MWLGPGGIFALVVAYYCCKGLCEKSESDNRQRLNAASAQSTATRRRADADVARANAAAARANAQAAAARQKEQEARWQAQAQLQAAQAQAAQAQAQVAQKKNLSEALSEAKLSQYEDALRDLGCAVPEDLGDLEESDLMEIGMKKIECKRLQRVAAQ